MQYLLVHCFVPDWDPRHCCQCDAQWLNGNVLELEENIPLGLH